MCVCLSACWDTTPLGPGTPPDQAPPQIQAPSQTRHPLGPGTLPTRQPPPRAEHAGRYGQRVGGTHPTGMHSC